MDRDGIERVENFKKRNGIDAELAKSSALLSRLSADEIKRVNLADVVERTKKVANLKIIKFLNGKGGV